MTAAVVQFPAPKRRKRAPVILTGSPAFEEAWLAYPETGRLRSSRKLAVPEWQSVAAEIGEPALLAAVRRYTTEDKQHRKDHGAPAFHRWLNWGRWEHWLAEPRSEVERQRFEPESYRQRFVQLLGEDFVVSWIDQCRWANGGLVAPRRFTVDTLRRTFSAKRISVSVEESQEPYRNTSGGAV
jgi:hypothetical protein